MGFLDRIRFTAGDEFEGHEAKVWQGFDADALNGSAGFPMVYVTADTLAKMAQYDYDLIKDDAWQALHNAPEGFWDQLAFGGETKHVGSRPDAVFAPDGVTPLYLVGSWTVAIVQRWNPDGGRTYDIVDEVEGVEKVVGTGHWGVWENERPVVGNPEPVGFVVNPEYWAEGRGDTPPFATPSDDDEDEDEPEHPKVATVTIEYTNGSEAKMDFAPAALPGDLDQSGTSYSGDVPSVGHVIEEAISEAVTNANLWPTA